ncbi:hypothetical protein Salat_1422000 [Sesamum alatum]|uniref:Uncharacterized protein n=1 Tax=Sesamum alatum TaxID=300844 RepID=A0AAE1YAB5_9LAMI|nr:hypothetical protein Salat_1422000 [Sesamum alatum]
MAQSETHFSPTISPTRCDEVRNSSRLDFHQFYIFLNILKPLTSSASFRAFFLALSLDGPSLLPLAVNSTLVLFDPEAVSEALEQSRELRYEEGTLVRPRPARSCSIVASGVAEAWLDSLAVRPPTRFSVEGVAEELPFIPSNSART